MSHTYQSELSALAAKVLTLRMEWNEPPPSKLVGCLKDRQTGEYCIRRIFPPSLNIVLGYCAGETRAAIYSDACQLHFGPWLRKRKLKLSDYNHGPQAAADFLARNPEVQALLDEIENLLVEQRTIPSRAKLIAGQTVKTTDEQIAKLIERAAKLERRIELLEREAGSRVTKAHGTPLPVVSSFTPPGSRTITPKFESVKQATAKSVFGI